MSAELERVLNLSKETLYQNVPVSVLCLGEVCFAGFGGEAFTDYGRRVSEALPDKYILTACLVNGGQGYLPTKEAYEEGGYEANSSRFSSSLPDTVIGCAVDLIKEYDK